MLEIENVTAEKEGVTVLRGVSANIGPGERVLLAGPNGSGKTSLARIVMGDSAYHVTDGRVLLDRQDITGVPAHERARRGIFVAFQSPLEIPGVSVFEFLFSAVRERDKQVEKESVTQEAHLDAGVFEETLRETAGQLGVDESLLWRGVNEGFSGGERKKLELLQAVVLRPSYVVLDEPDSGLDASSVKIIGSALDLMEPACGVLIISHDVRRTGVKSFDRVYLMGEGSVVQEGGMELVETATGDHV